ncbi:hypothetical protein BUALT_Bualt02G0235400 [Buddleja alternifolia]|uniref:Uncharacterized protein n=1 Tax=Buddleja alternifolia TaxID=168488 RepID=A0AAV6Y6X9_9LAMI|nr:hypothetical protein BUALT_Bualt02G0235400 [Buddleja alternifolia]
MDENFSDCVPCSSLAVDSVIRMSSAGVIWGSCVGPFDAKRLGLSGSARASFIAKSVGQCGFSCGLFAAIFSFAHCGIQRYRGQKDWVNTLAAGVVAGAAFGAGTRNWKQVAGVTGNHWPLYEECKEALERLNLVIGSGNQLGFNSFDFRKTLMC